MFRTHIFLTPIKKLVVLPSKNENKVYFSALLAEHTNRWVVAAAQGLGVVHGVRETAGLKAILT